MPDHESPGIGELSRQVRDVLVRFEGLATRLETQFVRSDNFKLYQQLVDQAINNLQDLTKSLARADAVKTLEDTVKTKASESSVKTLEERVDDLEDDKKWITRLVIGFIVLGILGAVFAVSQGASPK